MHSKAHCLCPLLPPVRNQLEHLRSRGHDFTVYCGQTAGWTKTPLGEEVDLGSGHIVLDGESAPPAKGAQQPPLLGPCLLWLQSPISAIAELFFVINRPEKKKRAFRQMVPLCIKR